MKRVIGSWVVLPSCFALLSGCTYLNLTGPLLTPERVDLERYQGEWYELARLPNWFQVNCVQSKAAYTLTSADSMRVENSCTTAEGDAKTSTGTALVTAPVTRATFEVEFENAVNEHFPGLVKGDYYIVYVDPEYQNALVGTPSRRYLWLLSRKSSVAPEVYERLVRIANQNGFDTDRVIKTSES